MNNASFFPIPDVQLLFRGADLVNHGLVVITDISTMEPLLCVTDRVGIATGQWYFPSENEVSSEPGDNFYQISTPSAVGLIRMSGGTSGIYRCEISNALGMVQTVYVGIYANVMDGKCL